MLSSMINALNEHLIATMAIKPSVVASINIEGLVNTIFAVSNIDRNATSMNGEPLSDFKLDERLSQLVLPRGVFIDGDYLANDLMDHAVCVVDSAKVLDSTSFITEQAKLLGACRKAVKFTTDLGEASQFATLGLKFQELSFQGCCHMYDRAFMPIPCNVRLFNDVWYYAKVGDVMKRLMVSIFMDMR